MIFRILNREWEKKKRTFEIEKPVNDSNTEWTQDEGLKKNRHSIIPKWMARHYWIEEESRPTYKWERKRKKKNYY